MKRYFYLHINLFFVLFFISGGELSGQSTAANFLTITPDSRAAAMGQTGVAGNADANSIFWNGAKLPFAERKFGIGLSFTPWLRSLIPDASLSTLAFYYKPDSVSAFSSSLRYFSQGNIIISNAQGVLGQYRPDEFAFDLCYARKTGKHFSGSVTGRFMRSDVYDGLYDFSTVNYWAVDLGLFYKSELFHLGNHISQFNAGISSANMGPKVYYYYNYGKQNLPTDIRIGGSLSMWFVPFNKLTLQTEMDNYVSDVLFPKKWDFRSGLEYEYNRILDIRAGYYYSRFPFVKYFTLGGGIRYSVFDLDLAYFLPVSIYHTPDEKGIRFTMMIEFGKINGLKKNKS